jgi:hypothetical protein
LVTAVSGRPRPVGVAVREVDLQHMIRSIVVGHLSEQLGGAFG